MQKQMRVQMTFVVNGGKMVNFILLLTYNDEINTSSANKNKSASDLSLQCVLLCLLGTPSFDTNGVKMVNFTIDNGHISSEKNPLKLLRLHFLMTKPSKVAYVPNAD